VIEESLPGARTDTFVPLVAAEKNVAEMLNSLASKIKKNGRDRFG
jgi:hypothetical protein